MTQPPASASRLIIQLVGPERLFINYEARYNITVINPGSAPASNITITAPLPKGARLISASDAPTTQNDAQVVWTIATLQPHEKVYRAISLTVTEPGQTTTKATVTSANTSSDTASARTGWVTPPSPAILAAPSQKTPNATPPSSSEISNPKSQIPNPDPQSSPAPASRLAIELTGPANLFINSEARYNIAVTNVGPSPANNITITASLPRVARLISASDTPATQNDTQIVWTIATLQPNEKVYRALSLTTPEPGRTAATATAAASNARNVAASAPTDWQAPPGVLTEIFDDTDPVRAGDTATYTIRITNQGSYRDINNQPKIIFSDQLTPLETDAPRATINGQTVTLPDSILKPKAVLTFKIKAKATQPGLATTRLQFNSSFLPRPVIKEETTCIYAPGQTPDLPSILTEVVDSADPLVTGDTVTFTIRITNQSRLHDLAGHPKVLFGDQLTPTSCTDPAASISGKIVTLPDAILKPGAAFTTHINAKAAQSGIATTRLEYTSPLLPRPVIKEEATYVYGGSSATPTATRAPRTTARGTGVTRTPATAPAPAAASGQLQTGLEAIKDLASQQPPASLTRGESTKWRYDRNQEITKKVMEFYNANPQDPRRWEAILLMLQNQPVYYGKFDTTVRNGQSYSYGPNVKANNAWFSDAMQLAAKLKTSSDVPDQTRRDFEAMLLGKAWSDLRFMQRNPTNSDGTPRQMPRALTTDYRTQGALAAGLKNFFARWPDYDASTLIAGYLSLAKNGEDKKAMIKEFQNTPNTSVRDYINKQLNQPAGQ